MTLEEAHAALALAKEHYDACTGRAGNVVAAAYTNIAVFKQVPPPSAAVTYAEAQREVELAAAVLDAARQVVRDLKPPKKEE